MCTSGSVPASPASRLLHDRPPTNAKTAPGHQPSAASRQQQQHPEARSVSLRVVTVQDENDLAAELMTAQAALNFADETALLSLGIPPRMVLRGLIGAATVRIEGAAYEIGRAHV